jgi:hypothetical protein
MRFMPWRLRGSRTVPRTRFTAPTVWHPTPASLAALIAGLWLFGTGEALLLASHLGAAPWSVLAQGISVRTGAGIGWTTLLVSICVLALWIPLRQKPGLGTVMNILVIALALGVTYPRVSTPHSLIGQLGLVFLGVGIPFDGRTRRRSSAPVRPCCCGTEVGGRGDPAGDPCLNAPAGGRSRRGASAPR